MMNQTTTRTATPKQAAYLRALYRELNVGGSGSPRFGSDIHHVARIPGRLRNVRIDESLSFDAASEIIDALVAAKKGE